MKGRAILALVIGVVLVGLAFSYMQRRTAERNRAVLATEPAAPAAGATATADEAAAIAAAQQERTAEIHRMEGRIEHLRLFALAEKMVLAKPSVYRVLPTDLEEPARTLGADDILEAYVDAQHTRYFFILKPGDRAYAIIVIDPRSGSASAR